MMRPGRTTATYPSILPLPLPMRVSAGFFGNGLSGKIRIHSLPPRLMYRVIARRAASICLLEKPFTKKPAETRMGSGKGNIEGYVAVVRPGRIMFELAGVDEANAKEALTLARHKLPIKTKFVARAEGVTS